MAHARGNGSQSGQNISSIDDNSSGVFATVTSNFVSHQITKGIIDSIRTNDKLSAGSFAPFIIPYINGIRELEGLEPAELLSDKPIEGRERVGSGYPLTVEEILINLEKLEEGERTALDKLVAQGEFPEPELLDPEKGKILKLNTAILSHMQNPTEETKKAIVEICTRDFMAPDKPTPMSEAPRKMSTGKKVLAGIVLALIGVALVSVAVASLMVSFGGTGPLIGALGYVGIHVTAAALTANLTIGGAVGVVAVGSGASAWAIAAVTAAVAASTSIALGVGTLGAAALVKAIDYPTGIIGKVHRFFSPLPPPQPPTIDTEFKNKFKDLRTTVKNKLIEPAQEKSGPKS